MLPSEGVKEFIHDKYPKKITGYYPDGGKATLKMGLLDAFSFSHEMINEIGQHRFPTKRLRLRIYVSR